MRYPQRVGLSLFAILMLAFSLPSWAWSRVYIGYRGWGGVRPWHYAYPYSPYYPYYADDLYYPYAPDYYGFYDAPYRIAPVEYAPVITASPVPEAVGGNVNSSGGKLGQVLDRLSGLRREVDFLLSDGDISQSQKKAAVRFFDDSEKQARAAAEANGGTLTGDQEKTLLQQLECAATALRTNSDLPASTVDLSTIKVPASTTLDSASSNQGDSGIQPINDLLLELRALLHQKLKNGDITKAQQDSEMNYLAEIDRHAHYSQRLTPEQANEYVNQLHKAYHAINHNFIQP